MNLYAVSFTVTQMVRSCDENAARAAVEAMFAEGESVQICKHMEIDSVKQIYGWDDVSG